MPFSLGSGNFMVVLFDALCACELASGVSELLIVLSQHYSCYQSYPFYFFPTLTILWSKGKNILMSPTPLNIYIKCSGAFYNLGIYLYFVSYNKQWHWE